jgi:hypothetical protein
MTHRGQPNPEPNFARHITEDDLTDIDTVGYQTQRQQVLTPGDIAKEAPDPPNPALTDGNSNSSTTTAINTPGMRRSPTLGYIPE